MGEDVVDAIDRVLNSPSERAAFVECPRNILQYAKEEILRLRSLAGPVTTTPTASEIYAGLRHPSPVADAEGA